MRCLQTVIIGDEMEDRTIVFFSETDAVLIRNGIFLITYLFVFKMDCEMLHILKRQVLTSHDHVTGRFGI